MSANVRVYISAMGIVSPLGNGVSETKDGIQKNLKGIRLLDLFPTGKNAPLPVGQVPYPIHEKSVPRTHALARVAAAQAMANRPESPDAVVMGITTGGMLTTESLLKRKERNPAFYRYHSPGSVAEDIASRYRCKGPVITVSTACSSGAAAIKIALEMLRAGMALRVLAGGADSLCRLTYYGFNSLQLIDPHGARPLDKNRLGMSVAEGAAMFLLSTDGPENAVAEILGAGLSCDAYHPTAPHPEGKGALAAMEAAVLDAGIHLSDIDYINLHGTGTWDNDLSEARALKAFFTDKMPALSSVKGAFGHSLAAAGAVETVVSAISISDQLIPANTGCIDPDPELNLNPVSRPKKARVSTVLSNSFGFGGNNASIVIAAPGKYHHSTAVPPLSPLMILGSTGITGAGNTKKMMENVYAGKSCAGMLAIDEISKNLSPGKVRRLKRLPRLALSLAVAAHEDSGETDTPSSIFFGTGWGALSETANFLNRLEETDERYPSPTDFVGSVHNAPAGQIAMLFQAMDTNITTTGGDYSFEQSLMTAELMMKTADRTCLVLGADEGHGMLSELFDPSVLKGASLSDGGGALCLGRGHENSGPAIHLPFYENTKNNPNVISALIRSLGGAERINEKFGVLLAGIPAGFKENASEQLNTFLSVTGFKNTVIDYRKLTGEFASASALAAVMAVRFLLDNTVPGRSFRGKDLLPEGRGVLVIGLGDFVTAMEVMHY